MRNLLFFILLALTACQKESNKDLGTYFDFWIINGKISKDTQTVYTLQSIKDDKNGTIGIIYSDDDWASKGDSLIKVADGSFMRWKVVNNPNHPDWGKGKEVNYVW